MMKTRFCPSPTGQMHLGNVRTALFNVLLALNKNGKFLLRIEDTDKVRSEEKFTKLLQFDMHWLGLTWDEGPYWQSQRQDVYDHYYIQLEQQKAAYPCFCSDEQLLLARKIQLSSGQPPRYTGTCANLSDKQIQAKRDQGLKPTLRFRVPKDQLITFTDLVKGEQEFKSNDIGDFIIRRADGTASFFFCNAIDDSVMGVTYAIRGEDHLANTPRQLLILSALGLPIPTYGHIALILGNDGAPLSKRNGSRSLQDLREEGYLAIAVNNYLARLGHYYEQNNLMVLEQLAYYFSANHLGTTPAHFDETQLLYWQKLAVMELSDDDYWQWLGANIWEKIPDDRRKLFIQVVRPNTVFPKDALFWAEVIFQFASIPFSEAAAAVMSDAAVTNLLKEAISFVQAWDANFAEMTAHLQKTLGVKGKALFQPLRVALTGELNGPEMAGMVQLLGKEKVLQRLTFALHKFAAQDNKGN